MSEKLEQTAVALSDFIADIETDKNESGVLRGEAIKNRLARLEKLEAIVASLGYTLESVANGHKANLEFLARSINHTLAQESVPIIKIPQDTLDIASLRASVSNMLACAALSEPEEHSTLIDNVAQDVIKMDANAPAEPVIENGFYRS